MLSSLNMIQDIMDDFHKLNKNIELSYMIKIMEEIRDEGIINIEKEGDEYIYTLNKELKLSEEGQKQYVGTLRPIVDWPTHLWRSFYNIRELNLTVAESCQYDDFLCKILSKAATQGFGPAYYVFQNLVKYYEKVGKG